MLCFGYKETLKTNFLRKNRYIMNTRYWPQFEFNSFGNKGNQTKK